MFYAFLVLARFSGSPARLGVDPRKEQALETPLCIQNYQSTIQYASASTILDVSVLKKHHQTVEPAYTMVCLVFAPLLLLWNDH
jgi:hypothetical protein